MYLLTYFIITFLYNIININIIFIFIHFKKLKEHKNDFLTGNW